MTTTENRPDRTDQQPVQTANDWDTSSEISYRPHPRAAEKVKPPKTPRQRLARRVIIGAGAGAAGLGIITGVVAGMLPHGDSKPDEKAPPVATAPAVPGSESSPSVASPENGKFVGEVLVQTLTIEQMDAIHDWKKFAQLSYADRAAYAESKGIPFATEGNEPIATQPEAIPSLYWSAMEGMSLMEPDPEVGAKISAAEFYYTADTDGSVDAAYQARIDGLAQAGGSHGDAETLVYTGSDGFKASTDRDGNPIDVSNVTSYYANVHTGVPTDTAKTIQAIRVPVKFLDGSIKIFYPQGFEVTQ